CSDTTIVLKLSVYDAVVVLLKKLVAASCCVPNKKLKASFTVICDSAFTNTGAASLTAFSAARFKLLIKLSHNLPIPAERNVFSICCASGGIRIFTTASPKKPLGADSVLMLLFRPLLSACLIPVTASVCVMVPLWVLLPAVVDPAGL